MFCNGWPPRSPQLGHLGGVFIAFEFVILPAGRAHGRRRHQGINQPSALSGRMRHQSIDHLPRWLADLARIGESSHVLGIEQTARLPRTVGL